MSESVFTIGHSTHPIEGFLRLLAMHSITAVVDVRSSPYSRMNPHFNREALSRTLRRHRIEYVFLGEELGARSEDPTCYVNGRVQYDLLAQTSLFRSGIKRILDGAEKFRIALVCAEKDPLMCHRAILVARTLAEKPVGVSHILSDGSIETHAQLVDRMLRRWNMLADDMFSPKEHRVPEAYRLQGDSIAYEDESLTDPEDRFINQVRENQP
jgi:uncharacterized protein (DUF488 family)